jgi:hypothetical protein
MLAKEIRSTKRSRIEDPPATSERAGAESRAIGRG